MISLKKSSLALIVTLLASSTFAQEKGDLGFMISSSDRSRIALEYRKPMKEQYHFRLGATYGSNFYNFPYTSTAIIKVNDSTLTQRYAQGQNLEAGLRIGLERRMSSTMFSFGLDLNINYRQQQRSLDDVIYYHDTENENYDETTAFNSLSYFDASYAQITRHFIVPSLRGTFNMNVPLGPSFILTLSAAVDAGAPIYMGATNITDPDQNFIGSPSSIFDMTTNFGIGLRYNLGSLKKSNQSQD